MRLAIIKLFPNPVGNITVLPFQQNFNYGVGPYTRFQYNLNVQPVLPIMLSKNMNLISRTIIPVLVQPSFAPPTACATAAGCGSTFGISDVQEQLYFAPKTKPDALIWGVGPISNSRRHHRIRSVRGNGVPDWMPLRSSLRENG